MRPERPQAPREEGEGPEDRREAQPAELAWRSHPAAERKATAVGVTLLVIALAVLAGFWMRGVYWGLFAGLVLFLSLEAFYLPTRYELRAAGIQVRKPFSRAEREWGAFRSVWCDPLGVTLSPFGRRHWLESYRGIRLRLAAAGAGPDAVALQRWLLARLDRQRVAFHGLAEELAAAVAREESGPAPPAANEE